eukprot:gnl/TRDRNA2_/TRDRNA2_190830_c0_seq1.p1 gnl/TRDRNA2_/TRDRNA2_190830_c0~~gnl/TRDRNA2_/TRDRNA2_190830_c0_seq1.p1  ORF type:complete len:330 (-),score=33.40 gnl/TRDRNA2_/TRDRNA2_190830_c0_seq1:143-1132(-)
MADITTEKVALSRMALWWMLITSVAFVGLYVVAQPSQCAMSGTCMLQHHNSTKNNRFFAGLIAAALMFEATRNFLNYWSARNLKGVIEQIESSLLPGLLLSICFGALLLENLFVGSIWLVHVAASGVGCQEDQPVYTAITMEWLITVPCLLILTGKCALRRPIQEVSRPLVVTNLYIITSWSAHFLAQPWLRWAVITLGLAGYVWASWDMVQWTRLFHRDIEVDLGPKMACPMIRPVLTIGLIAIFGLYGVVYILGFVGEMTSEAQRSTWVVMNIGTKFLYSTALAGIVIFEGHDSSLNLLVNTYNPFERKANSNPFERQTMSTPMLAA